MEISQGLGMALLKSNSKALRGQRVSREKGWAPNVICILPRAFRVLSLHPILPIRKLRLREVK